MNGVSYWDERGKIITDKAEQIDSQTVRLHDRLLDPQFDGRGSSLSGDGRDSLWRIPPKLDGLTGM